MWKKAVSQCRNKANVLKNQIEISAKSRCVMVENHCCQAPSLRSTRQSSSLREIIKTELVHQRSNQVSKTAACVGSSSALLQQMCSLSAEANIPRGWDAGITSEDDDGG